MPKNKNKLTEEEEKKIKAMINDLTSNNEVSDEEKNIMENLLEKIIIRKKESKFKRGFRLIKALSIKLIILYIISLILSGFFMSGIVLKDKLQIFLVSLIVSLILTMLEALPYFLKNQGSKSYLFLFGIIIINVCLFNNFVPVFEHAYYWIFFFLLLEICYAVFMNYIIKRRFSI